VSQVEAWRELNRRVAADLERGEGDISAARVIEAQADRRKVSMPSVAQSVAEMVHTMVIR